MNKAAMLTVLLLAANTAGAASYQDGVSYRQQSNFSAAASAFRDVVSKEPSNLLALEQLATMEGWLNQFDAAIVVWQQYIALAPASVTGHMGLARVLYWKGEHDKALQSLDLALKQEANNAEILTLKGDVLLADNRSVEARRVYLQAQALKGGDVELEKKIARAIVPALWRIDAGVIADRYSATRGAENSMYTQLGYKTSATTTVFARIDRGYSFREVDYGLSVGGYIQPLSWLALNAEVGTTPDEADFRAKTTALLNGELLMNPLIQPLLGLKYARYTVGATTGAVTTITPGVRVNIAPASVELRYSASDNVDNSKTHVVQAKITVEREGYTPYIVYSSGKEALPPLALADVRVTGIGSVFDLSPVWSVRVDISQEKRKHSYDHDAFGLGLAYRF